MFDLMSFVVGASSGLLLGVFGTTTRTGKIKEENERLNKELLKMGTRSMNRKLYTHDAKGRFRRINNNADSQETSI